MIHSYLSGFYHSYVYTCMCIGKYSSRTLSDCYSEWIGGVERKGGVEEEGSGGVVNVVCSKMCVSIIITQV